ncbi:PREDICTED: alpha-L-fucosidase [Nicrophorus vespilloides]|uniref:alpha-L-fucosidase n=1 Tax=Nicrophorus vespilloides TaxID=110193 RepID=A0ABM1MGT1_NICVS|nr:PREDICTED: alpha-L-fucosidase [Nicrophorus vespilloides]
MWLIYFLCAIASASSLVTIQKPSYEPTWESLDTRPLPKWYDKAKIGIFIHWGVFSVPSFGSEWFWMSWKASNQSRYVDYIKNFFPPGFTYQEFAKEFTCEFFDPDEWAKIFKNSGANYVVLTSKHHEGYTLWPSKYSFSWNSMDIGPKRDLVGDLSNAVRKQGMRFGLYHSLYEWFNPMYVDDRRSNFTRKTFVDRKIIPEMKELIEKYRPDVLWSDGDWEAYDDYWKSTEFLAWVYNESPVQDTIVVNDRWGIDIPCKHGDFFTCQDRFNPGVLQKHKWENAMTIDKESWGFRRNAKLSDYLTTHQLITTLIETVSCGGNILINVGPTKEGIITPIFQERLRDLGIWLKVNGLAIYNTTPWKYQNDTIGQTWYTTSTDSVYATTLVWPKGGILKLTKVKTSFAKLKSFSSVKLLGYEKELTVKVIADEVHVLLPSKDLVKTDWAWVVRFKYNELITEYI